MDHLEKLRTNERLPNKAQLNDEGVEYAITQTKDIYLKLSREEHHRALHEWNREKRKRVFSSIVREYLNLLHPNIPLIGMSNGLLLF